MSSAKWRLFRLSLSGAVQVTSHYLDQWRHTLLPHLSITQSRWVKSSLSGENMCPFADESFKCVFMNEKFYILMQFSLMFVPKVPIDNKSALVEIMAWQQTGDKPLPEPMLTQYKQANMQHQGRCAKQPVKLGSIQENCHGFIIIIIPPEQRSCWGVYWFHSVCLSVRPSVHLSVPPAVSAL